MTAVMAGLERQARSRKPAQQEGIVIEPLRKSDGNGSDEPVRLEDFRSLK